jgi:hypothetical protein
MRYFFFELSDQKHASKDPSFWKDLPILQKKKKFALLSTSTVVIVMSHPAQANSITTTAATAPATGSAPSTSVPIAPSRATQRLEGAAAGVSGNIGTFGVRFLCMSSFHFLSFQSPIGGDFVE